MEPWLQPATLPLPAIRKAAMMAVRARYAISSCRLLWKHRLFFLFLLRNRSIFHRLSVCGCHPEKRTVTLVACASLYVCLDKSVYGLLSLVEKLDLQLMRCDAGKVAPCPDRRIYATNSNIHFFSDGKEGIDDHASVFRHSLPCALHDERRASPYPC